MSCYGSDFKVNMISKVTLFTFLMYFTGLIVTNPLLYVISKKKKMFVFVIFNQSIITNSSYETTFLLRWR